MSLRGLLPAASVVLAAATVAAQSQVISPMLYEGPRISLESHAATTRSPNAPAERSPSGTPRPMEVDRAAFSYHPDLARRRANLASFVARTRTVDPKGAADLARMFAGEDVFAKMAAAIAPHGLGIDNLADAYALYWINAWSASRGHNETPSDRTIASVQAQAARALATTSQLRDAGDGVKQELAEALWLQAAMLDTAVEQAKGSPDRLRAIAAAARQGAGAMGIDVAIVDLTEQGFTPRR